MLNSTKAKGILLLAFFVFSFSVEAKPIYIGLFVGNNSGLPNEPELEFASADAKKVAGVLNRGKQFTPDYSYVLINKKTQELSATFNEIKGRIKELKKENEIYFLFYYSGHGDSSSLHLNGERFNKTLLLDHFNSLDTHLKIMLLDACESGGLIKKGIGFEKNKVKRERAKGKIFLSSSSPIQSSYESKKYSGAIFTYHFVEGLKGIADFNKDKIISLNESFQYANFATQRDQSLQNEFKQSPSYNYDYQGRDEIKLMDYMKSNKTLEFRNMMSNKILIINKLNPSFNQTIYLDGRNSIYTYLGPSLYQIQYEADDRIFVKDVDFRVNQSKSVSPSDFKWISKKGFELRGKGIQQSNYYDTELSFVSRYLDNSDILGIDIEIGLNQLSNNKGIYFDYEKVERSSDHLRENVHAFSVGVFQQLPLLHFMRFDLSVSTKLGVEKFIFQANDSRPFLLNTQNYLKEIYQLKLQLGPKINYFINEHLRVGLKSHYVYFPQQKRPKGYGSNLNFNLGFSLGYMY